MDCKIVNILLHPYFDGELDEGTAASVKAHLSECVECERELAALQALREATKRAAPRYTAPESLRQRLAQSSVHPSTADLVRRRGRSLLQSRWLAMAASLVLVILMTIQVPTNFRVCLELQKDNPDNARIASLTNRYFFAVALQGVMQIVTIIIMARFATGI